MKAQHPENPRRRKSMRYRAWLIAALMAAIGALVFAGCGG